MRARTVKTPTLKPGEIASAPLWTEWARIYDQHATLGIISELQKTYRVRVVREVDSNVVYVQKAA